METVVNSGTKTLCQSEKKHAYIDMLAVLLASFVIPTYLYGVSVIWLLLTGAASALVFEYICLHVFMRTKRQKGDYSSVITGMIVSLLMPATAPFWVVIAAVCFALCIAKYPFGGTGKNIFNPAASGVAFAALCWPEYVLKYPAPFSPQSVASPELIQYADSPASVLRVGGTPKIDYFDIMLGKFAGPIGATCMIVLGAALLYLLFRRAISSHIVFSSIATLFVLSVLFPRVVTGTVASVIYEFASGGIIFCIIFMVNDPATMPTMRNGKIIYGIMFGIAVFLFRQFGTTELDSVYAVIICNVFAGSCDKLGEILKINMQKAVLKYKEKRKLKAANSDEKDGALDA